MVRHSSKLSMYFVIKDDLGNENNASEDMQLAFMTARDWELKPQWIKQNDCMTLKSTKKGSIFILEEFDEDFLQGFITSNQKVRILGAKCLLTCFTENATIPLTSFPLHNLAMHGLVVTSSNLSAETKGKLRRLVRYMGGMYSDVLMSSTTHLVVCSLFSFKYFIACEKRIHIMAPEWVDNVWQRSLKENVKAADEKILETYKCPIFYKLTISCSKLQQVQKKILKDKILQNGGKFEADMIKDVTNILIIPVPLGEKYVHAQRWKLKCLHPSWILDSISKGYALPFDNYVVRPGSEIVSTQVPASQPKSVRLIDTNESDLSLIPSHNEKSLVNDTDDLKLNNLTFERLSSKCGDDIFKTPQKSIPVSNTNNKKQVNECDVALENCLSYKKILDTIQISDVKRCGHLLDGCKVYLAGFNATEEEKLRKILNHGGAVRFSEFNESITHVIVGNANSVDMAQMKLVSNKPHVVKLEWLSMSIRQGCLVKESSCTLSNESSNSSKNKECAVPQQQSPLSKKGLEMLHPVLPVSTTVVDVLDHNLIEKYSQSSRENHHEAAKANSQARPLEEAGSQPNLMHRVSQSTNDNTIPEFLAGLKFAILPSNADSIEGLRKDVANVGGIVVAGYRGVVDYTIAPFFTDAIKVTSGEVVTHIWLEECYFVGDVVEVKYYHQPVIISQQPAAKLLKNCVITFSSYLQFEKQYLEKIATFLGARCQDTLARKPDTKMNAVPTTHLICPNPQGSKYKAAKKWNLPIINEMWLRESFLRGVLLPFENYLVSECKGNCEASVATANQCDVANSNSKTTLVNRQINISNSLIFKDACRKNRSEFSNFRAVATSTKIDEITSEGNGATCSVAAVSKPSSFLTPAKGAESIAKFSENTSADKCTEQDSVQKITSKINNGPTSLLLEMHTDGERRISSAVKRKCKSASDHRSRSPKKKAICLEKDTFSPLEQIGWQDTLSDLNHTNTVNTEVSNKNEGVSDTPVASVRRNLMISTRSKNEDISETPVIPVRRNIMISVAQPKRQQYESVVTDLGGNLVSAYENERDKTEKATHLVTDQLKKTEKLLCSLASGLWVLHPSYLDECRKNHTFLREDEFEWGNPKNDKLFKNIPKDYKLMANAAYRWRLTIAKKGLAERAFVGMEAVIISSKMNGTVESLTRVVRSGGGKVLPVENIFKATHCFLVSDGDINEVKIPLEVLAGRKIHVLPAVYLSDSLINYPAPDAKSCYIKAYKRFFE